MKTPFNYLLVVFLILLSIQFAHAQAFAKYKKHEKYDNYFAKYSKRFFGPAFDWHVFKAQAIAESNLMPEAESYVGAQGVMQIMPRTYQEIINKNQFITGAATEPKSNIAAGIYYDKQKWDFWTAERTLEERLKFMFASYNAGAGNVLKAQKKSEQNGIQASTWEPVSESLKEVTGKHSTETINYVEKIFIIHEDIN
ncbi:transglycosylase SLT domain-containing protein [Marinicellulosiphila megalodicopiae]|uniref:transglycosylase SLT domain-containing protein n=1 Tax=Marinicellulosiphila megalodicopiae TaxID=2724896 RepID=UPI003BAE1B58